MKTQKYTFLITALISCGFARAAVENEWTFEADSPNQTLRQAHNSGEKGVSFSTDTQFVTQTDGGGGLACAHEVAGNGGQWDDGARLVAPIDPQSTGVHYLRYDLEYDMTAANNDSGTLLGLSFANTTESNSVGIVLQYVTEGTEESMPKEYSTDVLETELALTGSLSVIAEVDLDEQVMNVWYSLSGAINVGDSNAPHATITDLALLAIDELQFTATGDLIATPERDCVVFENIRTASTWADISGDLLDAHAPTKLTAELSTSLGCGIAVGQTNMISYSIYNSGGDASDVTSILGYDATSGLIIISSNNFTGTLLSGETVVHSYYVIGTHNGDYTLTAQAFSTEDDSESVEFLISVGSKVSFVEASITNDFGGIYPGEVEPGETFEVTVYSLNEGALDVTNVTNRLIPASSQEFPSIIALDSMAYDELLVGKSTSTTYRVTCADELDDGAHTFTVQNSMAGSVWSQTFTVDVRSDSIPSVVETNIVMVVTENGSDSVSVTLVNDGNTPIDYSISLDGLEAVGYSVEYGQRETLDSSFKVAGIPENTDLQGWGSVEDVTDGVLMDDAYTVDANETVSDWVDCALEGTTWSRFRVGNHGWMNLEKTDGSIIILAPFISRDDVDLDSIRYHLYDDKLVVAWGNNYWYPESQLEFQVWIHSDGAIQYLYEYGDWPEDGQIGITSSLGYQAIEHIPGNVGNDCVKLSPEVIVTVDPMMGSVDGSSSNTLTFSATDLGTSASDVLTNHFTATVDWGISTHEIEVVLIKEKESDAAFAAPSEVTLSGPAGYISAGATFILENTGNAKVNYRIVDESLQAAGYDVTDGQYNWQRPTLWEQVLDESDLGVTSVEIGFSFSYFGSAYSDLIVELDGTLTLDEGVTIVPQSAGFALGDQSVHIYRDPNEMWMMVYWEDMTRADGSEGQSFRAILYRNGCIHFDYQTTSGNWQDATIELTASGRVVEGTLIRSDNTNIDIISTPITRPYTNWAGRVTGEETIGTNITEVITYDSSIGWRGLDFTPAVEQCFSMTPSSGILGGNSSVEITVKGNSTAFTTGDTNAASFSIYGETIASLQQNLCVGVVGYQWIRSPTTDIEWYLVSTAGGNPRINKPSTVYINGSSRSEKTAGALTSQTWAWGDCDDLGFDTLYVRISSTTLNVNNRPENYVRKVSYSAMASVDVSLSTTASSEEASVSEAVVASMWGNESPVVAIEQNDDGSRTLTWPPADDDAWGRSYTIECTTSLTGQWTFIETVDNVTTYLDDDSTHSTYPVIFYRIKVAVQ